MSKLMAKPTRSHKLKEIVDEMKETSVVAARIVALVTRQIPKQPAKKKNAAVVAFGKVAASKRGKSRAFDLSAWESDRVGVGRSCAC